jgi:hypothetical protein
VARDRALPDDERGASRRPALPWLSAFPELNVRTYVRVGGRPGVYFFSLDAARTVAVHAARCLLNLPYHTASMSVAVDATGTRVESRRISRPEAQFTATYRPHDRAFAAAPGSLEYFLTERYCLYHLARRGVPYRLDIHHPPLAIAARRGRTPPEHDGRGERLHAAVHGASAALFEAAGHGGVGPVVPVRRDMSASIYRSRRTNLTVAVSACESTSRCSFRHSEQHRRSAA